MHLKTIPYFKAARIASNGVYICKKYDLVLKNDFYIMSDGWGSHIKNRRGCKSHKTHSN